MYSVIVTMTARQDQRQALEQALAQLAAAVRAHEPGAVCYHVLRSRDEPTRYRVLEIYTSKEAFKAHLNAAHVAQTNPQVLETLADAPQFEVVEVVE